MKRCSILILTLFLFYFSLLATNHNQPVRTRVDHTFIKKIITNKNNAFSGGDGAISIDLKDGRSLFLWGDSFIGKTKNNKRDSSNPLIVGNIHTTLDNSTSITYFKGDTQTPKPFFETKPIANYPTFLWPAHGFVNNNILHLFYHITIKTGKGAWDFEWVGIEYFRVNPANFNILSQQRITANEVNDIHLGFGFLVEDNEVYLYGTKMNNHLGELYVAKTSLINDNLSNFQFFDGERWTPNAKQAKPMKGLDIGISEQFSIFKYQNQYILVSQERGIGTDKIFTFTTNQPNGIWKNKKLIYTTPESRLNKDLYTYNAMAHPQYINKNQLLISYCVNTHTFTNLYNDVSIYRPRFLWVSLIDILN